ncbi:MAG: pyridoxamine 5'-phosphate oxidase [Alphaproteobacteria bacterium]|nr:MAG: pyridoxamine 5'-phosphate oxidase [Alphaproteobacteria bacterium]
MEILRSQDPIELFKEWLTEASVSEPNDPEAVALATVSPEGRPSVRMVLLKGVDKEGFRFYTNLESRKAKELSHNQSAAMCFHWKTLHRQVRVEGQVTQVPAWAVDAYFKTRHILSRLGAWASRQSEPLETRDELEERVRLFSQKFKGQEIPRPPHWGGFVLAPDKIEFWLEGEGRLHDRFLFSRFKDGWEMTRLNP